MDLMTGIAAYFPLPFDGADDDDREDVDPVLAGRAVRGFACAILVRAIGDACRLTACRVTDAGDAAAFLFDADRDADLRAWCDLAAIDFGRLRRALVDLLADRGTATRLDGSLAERVAHLRAAGPLRKRRARSFA